MKQIPRKIYYDKRTGTVLLDTGESVGSVFEETIEQGLESYSVLIGRAPETVGCVRLEYGQYSEYFAQGYAYRVNPETGNIKWEIPPVEESEN
ncbi:hypothetical protein [Brevibacillus laterosporus]|uniref:hypothetical protein n=1 Tax=Brevibacillus laterosporus TaxID=1465 RepID=UPI002656719E|nr:hypothetical protein [Brevibacillus laterosporus]MDN9012606.1 hypothetical protein [Brevibacillus laterosporus]MDO0943694.1 hypothetical protein [Brevibacillus laterosporus]